MLPGAIFSGIDGSRQYETGEPGARSERNQQRYARFSEGLRRAAAYKEKKAAENEADKEDEDETKTDTVGPKGFKIGNDSTVVTGYRDPGFTIEGQKGRSILGAVGAGLTPFFPVTGQAIGAVGSLTGL
jgi:hypothetical protein